MYLRPLKNITQSFVVAFDPIPQKALKNTHLYANATITTHMVKATNVQLLSVRYIITIYH